MPERRILLGVIGRAHGVRELVRVTSHTAEPEALTEYGALSDASGRRFMLRWVGDGIAEVSEIIDGKPVRAADRAAAERLTNTKLFIERERLPAPDDDEYYLADLIGLTAVGPDGTPLGVVSAVHDYGAGASVEIHREHAGSLLLPFTAACVPEVNVAAGWVSVAPPDEVEMSPGQGVGSSGRQGVDAAVRHGVDSPLRHPPACPGDLIQHGGVSGPTNKPGDDGGGTRDARGTPVVNEYVREAVRRMTWRASVLTLFPEMFPGPLGHSLAGKALDNGIWSLETVQICDFAVDRHHSVDDTPFGGGAGMVLRPDVVDAAVEHVADGRPRLCLTPRGRRFTQADAARLAGGDGVILLCGRYEGIDQRVIEAHAMEEISVGDYVLSGGEPAALVLLDAAVRLLPGVMGAADSATVESFSHGMLEYPHYTRPAEWRGRRVPDVLLSGHHGAVDAWRREQSERTTQERRPDLWTAHLSGP